MNITPTGSRIIITPEKDSGVTESGIILSADENKTLEIATVTAVGPDVEHIEVGDNVVYKEYSVDTVKINNEEVTFIEADNVLGTF